MNGAVHVAAPGRFAGSMSSSAGAGAESRASSSVAAVVPFAIVCDGVRALGDFGFRGAMALGCDGESVLSAAQAARGKATRTARRAAVLFMAMRIGP